MRVFQDHFSDFPIGGLPFDYSAVGEYHCLDFPALPGGWVDTTNDTSWGRLGNWQVVEDGGRRVMQQARLREHGLPMLSAGDFRWRDISLEAPVLGYRNAFLDRLAAENPVQAVVAVGNGAQHAAEHWPGSGAFPVFEITHPAAHDEGALLANWNAALAGLRALVTPDDDGQADPLPYGQAFQDEDHAAIPTWDMPFGVPAWQGIGGGHSHRDGDKQIVWTAP